MFGPGEASKVVKAVRVLGNPTSSRTVNLKLSQPTGSVTLGSPSSATFTIQGAPPGPPEAIEKFDTACSSDDTPLWGCAGAHLATGYPSGPVETMEKLSVRRTGAVTDGVTLVLLRVRSSTPVTFELRLAGGPAPQEYGVLRQRDGTLPGQAVIVNPEFPSAEAGLTAYALYEAPAGLPAGATGLQVVATNGVGPAVSTPILLKPPPVV